MAEEELHLLRQEEAEETNIGDEGGRPPPPPSSSRRSLCCREMQLLEFPDKYVIRSTDPDFPGHDFSIGRSDGLLQPLSSEDNIYGTPTTISTIYGVIGIIRVATDFEIGELFRSCTIHTGAYVLVITSRKEVGRYLGFTIFSVKSMRFLSCNNALKCSTLQEKKDEAYFISLLKIVESTPGLYYSYEVDLTLNLQRASKLAEGRAQKPLWKQADPRFIWNRNLLEELIEAKLDKFIIPLIQGSFQTIKFTLKSSSTSVTLISRRCNRRLGTRMWRRGANFEGATANFIETEQLLEFEGFRTSFVQIRGSIPLLWEQIVDLSYKPQLNIIEHEETPKVVERHFYDLMQRYGKTVAVDLTDKHGDEGRISHAFAAQTEKLQDVRYVPFDFHHFCGKGNLDNLKILYDEIAENVEDHGYFLINAEGEILLEQSGVIRANCIDCLDRTNVTQSFLARKSLNLQLQRIGAFSSSECISMYADAFEIFKILWAEHGDEISLEYAGTHALKGDFVRYGRQTLSGFFKDGFSALSRYYLNNFQDGIRQDALDLVSGRYTVNRDGSSPFQLNGFESLSYLPVASALIVGSITMSTFTLNQAGRNAQHFVSSVLWAGLAAGVMAVVKAKSETEAVLLQATLVWPLVIQQLPNFPPYPEIPRGCF